ncbi:MAG: sugar ABC transporter permease [Lachnospiraceae bacterium]|nr:sugar ABC transporter permease [Lachnospiraceae bacterium]
MKLLEKKVSVELGNRDFLKEKRKKTFREMKRNYQIYILLIPVILYFLVFKYGPMYGAVIAFLDYKPAKGILGSDWVGFKNFITFFKDPYFFRIMRNTLIISFASILVTMPCTILFAVLINEIANTKFKRLVQTVTYLPHFISLIVICGMVTEFCSMDGIITSFFVAFGMERQNLLQNPDFYRAIHIGSQLWQGLGWGTIIYLSALSSIDQEQYEAASIDGAGRFAKMRYITLPCLIPTITIMLIMDLGRVMNVGYQKNILLANTLTLQTAEVIDSYIYRTGLASSYPRFSYSTAVGLFKSLVNVTLVVSANKFSRKVQGSGLW